MKRKMKKKRDKQMSEKDMALPVLNQRGAGETDCDDIDPEHCEELHHRHFTNDPIEIFHEVQTLEMRYKYSIAEMKAKIEEKVKEIQQENGERYRFEIEKRKKDLDSLVQALEREIQKNILALNSQEMFILAQIETIFQEKSSDLVNEMISQMGLKF